VSLDPFLVRPIIEAALREDLGRTGDITSNAVIPATATATARIMARAPGRIAGLGVAGWVFTTLNPSVEVTFEASDGDDVEAGSMLATVAGSARSILGAERVALNLLGRLSGIATVTARLVEIVAPHGTAIAGTRKTTPGLRTLEKYAIRVGGGSNHRFGLDDAVLIKDNHIAIAGGVAAAVSSARAAVGHLVKIEVEVDTLGQLGEALEAGPDVVLLDNMSTEELVEAVALVDGRVVIEASGGITPENVADIAATGVDVISLGWLTHSVTALDVALDVVI
jgi:nicotinate-nucleotide pyrophosphorylase (carboxylating)